MDVTLRREDVLAKAVEIIEKRPRGGAVRLEEVRRKLISGPEKQ